MGFGFMQRKHFCSFSGTMMLDVTDGKVEATDVAFQGLPAFNELGASFPFEGSSDTSQAAEKLAAGIWPLRNWSQVIAAWYSPS